jgi:DUF2971 family protein
MRAAFEDELLSANEPLWRYVRLDRMMESLTSRTLYFPSARQFEDPFEGATAVQPHDWPVDPRFGALEFGERAFEELRRLTKISSWHRADYESDAMWKLYAGKRKGVAIRTTVGRLSAGLKPFRLKPEYAEEEPYAGNIRYVDLFELRLQVSMDKRFFYKHRAFEWEREFRVAISVRGAEEYGVQVPEFGINVPFDPQVLIESIYVGPSLQANERTELERACEGAELRPQFKTSTLLGRPRYI